MGQQQQQPSNAAPNFAPAFGGLMNDHTAQMGFQMGQSAVKVGQEYVEQNVRHHQSESLYDIY